MLVLKHVSGKFFHILTWSCTFPMINLNLSFYCSFTMKHQLIWFLARYLFFSCISLTQLSYKYLSKLTIKLLIEGFKLQEHLQSLRCYHFMEMGDWADLFIMSLWQRVCSILIVYLILSIVFYADYTSHIRNGMSVKWIRGFQKFKRFLNWLPEGHHVNETLIRIGCMST